MSSKNEVFYLDIVRIYAVLLVAVSHFLVYTGHTNLFGSDIFLLGRFGVGLFFVHSFLVLCWSLERMRDQKHYKSAFIIRRVFRIFPLPIFILSLMLFFNLNTGYLSYASAYTFYMHELNALKYLLNYLLLSNLVKEGQIFGMMWSICLEFQAYIALPFFWYASRSASKLTVLLVLFIFYIFAYFAIPIVDSLNAQFAVLRIPPFITWAPVFYAGIVCYRFFATARPKIPLFVLPIWLIALTLLQFLSYDIFLTVIVSGLVALPLPWFREVQSNRLRRALAIIIRYTYGVFAFQYIALWICVDPKSTWPLWIQFIYLLVFLFLISVITYHVLEQPMIKLGKSLANRIS